MGNRVSAHPSQPLQQQGAVCGLGPTRGFTLALTSLGGYSWGDKPSSHVQDCSLMLGCSRGDIKEKLRFKFGEEFRIEVDL